MPVFPLFLELGGRPCLVAGAGAVGVAKARSLVEAGAEVLLVDPAPGAEALALEAADPRVTLERRAVRDEDCEGREVVFACTGDDDVDSAVERASTRAGAICCRADARARVASGAVLRRGEVCVAVSSGGASPALAAEARDRIAAVVGDEFAVAAGLLAGLRSRLKNEVADAALRREALTQPLVASLLEDLRAGRVEAARVAVELALERARAGAGDGRCTR